MYGQFKGSKGSVDGTESITTNTERESEFHILIEYNSSASKHNQNLPKSFEAPELSTFGLKNGKIKVPKFI